MNGIQVVRHEELVEGSPTPGMTRRIAQLRGDVSVIEVETEAGNVSDWHHHGEHATYGFVVGGSLRFEFGPAGDRIDLGVGDFFHVPPGLIHRESNPGSALQVLLGMRIGHGPAVVNVSGPA